MLSGCEKIRKLFRFKSSSTISIRTDRRRRIIDWPAKTFGKLLFSRSTRVHKLHECQLSLLRLGLLYRDSRQQSFHGTKVLLDYVLLCSGWDTARRRRKENNFGEAKSIFTEVFHSPAEPLERSTKSRRNFVPRNRNEKSIYCNLLCRRFKRFARKSLCESVGWTASCSDSHLNIQMRRFFMLG